MSTKVLTQLEKILASVLHLRERNFISDWINPSWRYDNCFAERHLRVTIAGTTADFTLHLHLDARNRHTISHYSSIADQPRLVSFLQFSSQYDDLTKTTLQIM